MVFNLLVCTLNRVQMTTSLQPGVVRDPSYLQKLSVFLGKRSANGKALILALSPLLDILSKAQYYSNIGCGVSSSWIQNQIQFWLKVNILKQACTQRKVGLFLINKLFPKGLIQSHINKNSSFDCETPLIFLLKCSELSI